MEIERQDSQSFDRQARQCYGLDDTDTEAASGERQRDVTRIAVDNANRFDLVMVQRLIDPPAQSVRVGRGQQAAFPKVLGCDHVPLCQRIVAGDDGDVGNLADPVEVDTRIIKRQACDADLCGARDNGLDDIFRRHARQMDVQREPAVWKIGQSKRCDTGRQCRNGSQPHGAGLIIGNVVSGLADRLQPAQKQLRLNKQRTAFFRRRDARPIPMQHGETKFALEVLDQSCHHRLGLAKRMGSTRHAANRHDRNKRFELARIKVVQWHRNS